MVVGRSPLSYTAELSHRVSPHAYLNSNDFTIHSKAHVVTVACIHACGRGLTPAFNNGNAPLINWGNISESQEFKP